MKNINWKLVLKYIVYLVVLVINIMIVVKELWFGDGVGNSLLAVVPLTLGALLGHYITIRKDDEHIKSKIIEKNDEHKV